MPTITIDGHAYDVPEGKTVLQACLERQIPVPYFCYHPKLSIAGNCRMCLVEIEGRPKLEIACNTTAQEGMVVKTKTPKVIEARQSVLEFILINHPLDCPICDQAGECDLQDQYFRFSAVPYRFREAKVRKPKAVPLGNLVMLDDERCILCTRCVRFCDEVAGVHELAVAERGDHSTIVTFNDQGMQNAYSLNTVDICPVGALTNRDFRFNKRVWFLKSAPSVCTGCARGCSIRLDHEGSIVYRYRPRENPLVNGEWMCDEGRLTYTFVNAPDRIASPYVRGAHGAERGAHGNGHAAPLVRAAWDEALQRIAGWLQRIPPAERGVVLSAQCTNEENFAWWWLAREIWKTPHLFATARRFANATEDRILRRADKNPNGRCLAELGVQRALTTGPRLLVVLDMLSPEEVAALRWQRPEVVIVLATNWGTDPSSARWRPLGEVRAILAHGGAARAVEQVNAPCEIAELPWADSMLPLATFAEQHGSFINADGVVQRIAAAFAPKGESQPAWRIAVQIGAIEESPWQPATAAEVFAAMAEIVPGMRGLTHEALGEQGVKLSSTGA
ncbi:MAG: (2Fe-2S)-binding protein [Deltaproteobacteria bacterium]|nr:(2Fe-2S)-binding protein [Deltaproteobacteria bacterium]